MWAQNSVVGWGQSLVLGPFSLNLIVCGRLSSCSLDLCTVVGHFGWCKTTLLVDMFVLGEKYWMGGGLSML